MIYGLTVIKIIKLTPTRIQNHVYESGFCT